MTVAVVACTTRGSQCIVLQLHFLPVYCMFPSLFVETPELHFCLYDFGFCLSIDDDDDGSLMQTVTHRLSAGSRDNSSSSPLSPVSSSQDWLSNKRRSHSFTSGLYIVINLNDLKIHNVCVSY